jgi:hypothetical protein
MPLRIGVAPVTGQNRSDRPGVVPETPVRGHHTGPSARTTSDSGGAADKKRASSPPLRELGIEHQLQLARRFRLGLPVLRLKQLGIGDELWIAQFATASVRSVRQRQGGKDFLFCAESALYY